MPGHFIENQHLIKCSFLNRMESLKCASLVLVIIFN